MPSIREAFAKTRKEGRAALVIYLTGGDPDLQTTQKAIVAATEAGADVIELGVPFSDPAADGPTIQKASERALAAGATFERVLDVVRRVRAEGCDVPIVLFGYFNPILRRGVEAAVSSAAEAGVDGFLVVDLPHEESGELRAAIAKNDLEYVPLVAPTTALERARHIGETASGFVYYVSTTGITGGRVAHLDEAATRAAQLELELGRPVAVGFGIRTPGDAQVVGARASGVVVGSAVVQALHTGGDASLRALVRSLRAALTPE